jgi:starch synthase
MRIALLSREYPPEVYGGAGVHVEYLARELARSAQVDVHCFGADRPDAEGVSVHAYRPWETLREPSGVLATISVDLAMAAGSAAADVIHTHTWYANFGGHLGKLLHGIPHVATTHSLEPLRPWKAEQLGHGGYALSCFCEQTALERADAVIAVSGAMRDDVLHVYPGVAPDRVTVIHNGIDPDEWRPDPGAEHTERLGVDLSRPIVLFVGRITRQKGIDVLLDAALGLDPEAELVIRAGSPDTPELAAEVAQKIERVREQRPVVWIDRMLEREELVQLHSHATVFCCPSVYEPLGIVNLEAMACETPVVASRVGGIPEVVDERNGVLVPPRDPAALAEAINGLLRDPERARGLGRAGRERVLAEFTWARAAERTLDLYRSLL